MSSIRTWALVICVCFIGVHPSLVACSASIGIERPSAPKKLRVEYSEDGANISWKKVSETDGYAIFREGKNGKVKRLAIIRANSYVDEKVKKAGKYGYRVCSVVKKENKLYGGKYTDWVRYVHKNIDPNKPMVALTFDDGPSVYTPDILSVLRKYDAYATFFVVGERIDQYADTIKKAYKQGCSIGSHSYSHARLGTASAAIIKKELNKTDKKLKSVLGFKASCMRPPYGS